MQTCRGSHTHTLLKSPSDDANLYVYVYGHRRRRGPPRARRLQRTTRRPDPNSSHWRIEVIRVPLAAPQNAAVVNGPRLFADPATGAINGLQNAPPTPLHPSGMPWGPTPITDACHDITCIPAIGLAAGACEGNGLLIDISDPANPVRIDEVADPNYAYWHGATFSNDGTKVVFTDEWGGGTAARCRVTDQLNWGANAIFDIVDRQARVPQLLQDAGGADEPGELRLAPAVARPGARPRHHGPGLVPGRRVGDRLHRLGEPEGDRATTTAARSARRARARRALVGLLLQRRRLRLRDRPRLRRLGADPRTTSSRERDRRPRPRSSSSG